MSEMTERVARAIAKEAWGRGLRGESLPWEKIPDVYRDGYRRWAVKAIEAMRDPTQAMLIAAGDWSIAKNDQGVGDDQAACYQAMIDEARK